MVMMPKEINNVTEATEEIRKRKYKKVMDNCVVGNVWKTQLETEIQKNREK